jgi:hypothetical protein
MAALKLSLPFDIDAFKAGLAARSEANQSIYEPRKNSRPKPPRDEEEEEEDADGDGGGGGDDEDK